MSSVTVVTPPNKSEALNRTFVRLLPGLLILIPFIIIALLSPYLNLQDPSCSQSGDQTSAAVQ